MEIRFILLNDTFMDDNVTGANSVKDALDYQLQLIKLCSLGQFELRKCVSHSNHILQAVLAENRAMSLSRLINSIDQSQLKLLGLKWDLQYGTF